MDGETRKIPIIIAGPTGAGKSAFAVELATRIDGEIIGADAYQVYAGLEVLTAQPGPELRARVPHHLIGVIPPEERFDAARFAAMAGTLIDEIQARGRTPILVGGSGLYLKALTHGLAELPPPDPRLRAELAGLPLDELLRRLDAADPAARQTLDERNPRRVLRALEIRLQTGRPARELRTQWPGGAPKEFRGLIVTREREELHERIAANVRAMFPRVLDEVAAFEDRKSKIINHKSKILLGPTAAMAIGLRDIQKLLRGETTEEECASAIIQSTRRYAKRQLTWFRNQTIFPQLVLTGLPTTREQLSDTLQALGLA